MLYRARVAFAAAVVVAGVILAIEFPVGQLVSARSAVSSSGAELAKVTRENRTLAIQVRDLAKGSTIEQIAHADYGLVLPGQRSIVIMPGGQMHTGGAIPGHSSAGTSAPLGSTTIPRSDIVPSDSQLSPSVAPPQNNSGGFWQRVLTRLEFWKASA
ncbi:MAG: FtsB family cell division protein [Acidimicrobiales bacterium]